MELTHASHSCILLVSLFVGAPMAHVGGEVWSWNKLGNEFSVFFYGVQQFVIFCSTVWFSVYVLQTVCNVDPFTCNGHFQLFNLTISIRFSPPFYRHLVQHTRTFYRQHLPFSIYKFSCHMDIMLSRCLDSFYSTHNLKFSRNTQLSSQWKIRCFESGVWLKVR